VVGKEKAKHKLTNLSDFLLLSGAQKHFDRLTKDRNFVLVLLLLPIHRSCSVVITKHIQEMFAHK
jgi:hypothetical protein